jgi:hypothetical protein
VAFAALTLQATAAPDEDLLGKAEGYPIGSRADWYFNERARVGSFSNLDHILPHYTLAKGSIPAAVSQGCQRTQDRIPVRTAELYHR